MYLARTPVLSVDQAAELGGFLARYAIRVSGLTVHHILENGQRVEDNPTRDTIVETAGETIGANVGAGAAVAAGVTLALPPVAILAGLAAIPALVKGQHDLRRKQVGGKAGSKAVSSEVGFDLADVSTKRRRWSEYLLSIYTARHGWTLAGLHHPEQLDLGARYAASHRGDPPPWEDSTQPPTWARYGERSAPPPTARTNQAPNESRLRHALRDLW